MSSPAASGARQAARPVSRAAPARRAMPAAAAAAWRANQELLTNATSLVATTGVTAALGFVYWAVAARLFSQQMVGYGSAAVSVMTLLGTIGMFGLGTVLIGELPRRTSRGGLVCAALLACGAGSAVLGLGFAILAPHLSARFREMSGTPGLVALLTAGVILTGVTMVFDQATIGLMRGGLQLSRNFVFALAKLLTLPAIAYLAGHLTGIGITLSWVAGMAVSLAPLALWLHWTGTRALARPDWAVLGTLRSQALAHNWLNLSIAVPQSLLPVLVTVLVSPTANAAFYAAWTLANFLYIVPTHLSTVLFAEASADPAVIARKLRFTLGLSIALGLPAMVVMGLGAHLALSLFGPAYASAATGLLRLLVIAYLAAIPRVHYIAVCRATGKVVRATVVITAAATFEVVGAGIAAAIGGLPALGPALLAIFIVEGLVTAPAVLRAALRHGRHRRPGTRTPASGRHTAAAGGPA